MHIETSSGLFPDQINNISIDCQDCGEIWERDGINYFIKLPGN